MSPRARSRDPRLPCPGVAFEPDFARRLELVVARLASARERREGAGTAGLAGGGDEFVGYRPYRSGEDLRRLDWNLLARLDRPFVRVTRREAGESWLVVLDASASMGVGPPGKLQRAAEVAACLAALACKLAAEVRIVVLGGAGDTARACEFTLHKRVALPDLLAFLERLRAGGSADFESPERLGRARSSPARAFIVSDFLACEPESVFAHANGRRDLALIRLLAPLEIAPEIFGAVEWWSPEDGARVELTVGEEECANYERELALDLERWRSACAHHRSVHVCFDTTKSFEDIVRASVAS